MDADEERYREALRAYCRVEFLFALVLTNERERSNTKKGAVTSPSNTPYGKFSFQFGVSAVYRLTPKKGRGLEAARIGG
jgi:hypothetical protein